MPLEYIFEPPVARRLAPWMTLSTVLALIVSGGCYLSGNVELGHWSTGVFVTADLIMIVSSLYLYYAGYLKK